MDTTAPEGKTTSELQSVTGYAASSVYADWNANVDGVSGNDDPWDFGEMMQYPMLDFDCMSAAAQGSLAMGMPGANGDYPVVGQTAGARLVDGPAMRAGARARKEAWQWQRSTDGVTWTDITEDGGATYEYTPTSSNDLNNCLRACVGLNETAPEGATQACVRMFAKTRNY